MREQRPFFLTVSEVWPDAPGQTPGGYAVPMQNAGMAGKTVLVTGATNGIGLVTARELARRGADVVILGRNADRTARVAQDVGAHAFIVADLSEMKSTVRAAAEFCDRYDRLDVLVNNAGAIFETRQTSSEGVEMTWALNHLAPFLLTRQLMSLLLVTPGSRVVTVASAAHQPARLDLNDPEFRARKYSAWGAYGQSKLANVLFARELARRGAGVQSYSLHPGMVASGFGHNGQGNLNRLYKYVDRFAITPDEGARTSVYLSSTSDQLVNGGYYVKRRPSTPSARALDDGAAYRLWELSEGYVQGAVKPRTLPTWEEILREVRNLTRSAAG